MSEILFVLGLVVLAFACFTVNHRLVRKLGALFILAATGVAVWWLTDSVVAGLIAAAGWFFLPWIEILLRVRQAVLPLERELAHRYPPNRDVFPALPELTGEIEQLGFEKTDDTGWEWGNSSQFMRLFYHPHKHQQAVVSLFDQGGVALTYVSLTNRTADGRTLTTWNYPFSYSLKFAPGVTLQRVVEAETFEQLQQAHERFVAVETGLDPAVVEGQTGAETGQSPSAVAEAGTGPPDADGPWAAHDPDSVDRLIEREMAEQMRYNLQLGLLQPVGDDGCRYSWRGCLFLWRQCLKDMVRL